MSAAVVAAKEQQHQQENDQHVERQQVQKEQAEVVTLEVVEAGLKTFGAICPEKHGDPALLRETRTDRSKLNWETCESDAEYLSAALRQVVDAMC